MVVAVMTIRLAGAEASAVLAAIHAGCFEPRECWDEAAMASLLVVPGTIAVLHGSAGMGMFRAAGGEAEVLTLAVLPDARRLGTGAALLEAGLDWCTSLGARAMFLEVAVANRGARALYERAGFSVVGSRRRYYEGGGDAFVMRAELTGCVDLRRRGALPLDPVGA